MNTYPSVSVIILNYNGRQWLADCLQHVFDLDYPKEQLEIIVGDNASTDDSVSWIVKYFSSVKVIGFNKNYGFCKSNNECARRATGEYLAFLNNDTKVSAGWLRALVEAAMKNEKIKICASKIFFAHPQQTHLLNAAGGVIVPSGCGLYDGWLEEDQESYQTSHPTGFACGAGLLVEKEFFMRTGGFDEYYFYSGEEMDLGFRAWSMGYQVEYVPQAEMHHYMGKTGFKDRGVPPVMEYLITRNNLYFILKNFQGLNVLRGLFLLELKKCAKFIYALLHGKFRVCLATLKAYVDTLREIKMILVRRRNFQQLRTVADQELQDQGVVIGVHDWFERNKKISQNMRKYSSGNQYYSDRDPWKIVCDEEGQLVFEEL